MAALTASCVQKNGPVTIQLTDTPEEGLFIQMETARLRIISVNSREYEPQLTALYGSKEVNRLVGSGATLPPDLVSAKIERWIKRWKEHNPFGAGFVVLKKQTGEFVGQIIVKPYKDKSVPERRYFPEMAEIGYLSMPEDWGKGYGKEFTHAMIHHLLPHLIHAGYKVAGHPLKTLIATTRLDNVASAKVLSTFMQYTGDAIRYGGLRKWYEFKF